MTPKWFNCAKCGIDAWVGGGPLCDACKHAIDKTKASGAGLAATTKGRKTRFQDRKRKANKEECRKWQQEE